MPPRADLPAATPVQIATQPQTISTPAVKQAAKIAPQAFAKSSKPLKSEASTPPAPAPLSTNSLSNVGEVLAALDETGQTRQMPAMPPMPAAPSAAPAAPAGSGNPSMSDTQVLKYLENRRSDGSPAPNTDNDDGISFLRPDDTGTVRALKEAVTTNQPVAFAVQLKWSVQPIELNEVPPLAIFSAYTLYTVEGSREGRKWFGLRLGFFTDAISAKQVAYYVRSEFASVAVVPVSPQERSRASEAGTAGKLPRAAAPPVPKKNSVLPADEFKLIDTMETPVLPKPTPAAAVAKPAAPARPAPAAAAAAAAVRPAAATPAPRPAAAASPPKPAAKAPPPPKQKAKTPGKVRAKDKRSPQSLEETLEILGADQLEIDTGRGELLNDTGVRNLKVAGLTQKNSPFSRLLDRLSERVNK
jgi:hypothetical protein